jgi:hypothetical protein
MIIGALIQFFADHPRQIEVDRDFRRAYRQFQQEQTSMTSLRDTIARAVANPSEAYAPGKTINDMITDHVMHALQSQVELVAIGDGPSVPVIIMGKAGEFSAPTPKPATSTPARESVSDQRLADLANPSHLVKAPSMAEICAIAQELQTYRKPFTDPLQVAGGWQVVSNPEGSFRQFVGYHYAEGPGDLRIRTNDRQLLDWILAQLDIAERISRLKVTHDRPPGELGAEEVRNREKRDMPERACRVCGCTQNQACVDDRGPCWWVGKDLCSHCADPAPAPKPFAIKVGKTWHIAHQVKASAYGLEPANNLVWSEAGATGLLCVVGEELHAIELPA